MAASDGNTQVIPVLPLPGVPAQQTTETHSAYSHLTWHQSQPKKSNLRGIFRSLTAGERALKGAEHAERQQPSAEGGRQMEERATQGERQVEEPQISSVFLYI